VNIKITRWVGSWFDEQLEITRTTKTMVVVRWGNGERRFNRKSGQVVGHLRHGMSGMTDPYISHEELQRFEACRDDTKKKDTE